MGKQTHLTITVQVDIDNDQWAREFGEDNDPMFIPTQVTSLVHEAVADKLAAIVGASATLRIVRLGRATVDR